MLNPMAFRVPGNTKRAHPVFLVGGVRNPVSYHEVLSIWATRKSRLEYFPSHLFADPAWDILLYVYAGRLAGKRSSVKDAVFGSNVPEATALRWIARLESAGLCERQADLLDRRRQFIELSALGVETMDRYFESVRGADDEGGAVAA